MNRPSLKETAYEALRGWIGAGRLPGGFVTSENRLAAELDMSRTPVRAALQQLEHEGFLRIVPKHGILILPDSAERVSGLLDMLFALPLFVCEQARHDRDKRGEMAAAIGGFRPFLFDRDLSPGLLCRQEDDFWKQFVSIARNREMLRYWQTTSDQVRWLQNDRRWKPPFRLETEERLEQLLDAMESGCGEAGRELFAYLRVLKQTWS